MHEGPYGGHVDVRMSPILSKELNSSIRISQSQNEILMESHKFPETELGGGVLTTEIHGWDEEKRVM